MFHRRISLTSVLLQLLGSGWNIKGFRLELIHISLIEDIRSSLTHLHGFQLFFCLYQKDKSYDSKVNFRQASNHCKRVLQAAKLAYATKLLPRNLAPVTFGKLLIVFSTKVNLLYLL